jgi:hypothetical protein
VYDPPDPDLSHLLHSFSQSDQRRIIRQHAQEVPLESITFENFTALLSSLFGVTFLITTKTRHQNNAFVMLQIHRKTE